MYEQGVNLCAVVIGIYYVLSGWAAALEYGKDHVNAFVGDGTTWIIDLDTIVENAQVLAAEAKRLGLTTYLMSKQYARNPYVSALALANGLNKIVAVDKEAALV